MFIFPETLNPIRHPRGWLELPLGSARCRNLAASNRISASSVGLGLRVQYDGSVGFGFEGRCSVQGSRVWVESVTKLIKPWGIVRKFGRGGGGSRLEVEQVSGQRTARWVWS